MSTDECALPRIQDPAEREHEPGLLVGERRHRILDLLREHLRPESNSLSGHMAESALAGLQADRLFLGADGLDPERGVMTPHLPEAQLNAQMIAISRQVIAVADSSKLLRRNISLIARVEQLHMLITDSDANPTLIAELRRRGVEVRLA